MPSAPLDDAPDDAPEPRDQRASVDPVLVRRRQWARFAELGQRTGYGLFGLAVVLFVIAAVTDLPSVIVDSIVVALLVGSAVLAPAIVVGYGVKAADREDRERGIRRN
jgi:hypothetical protein